MHMVKTYLEIDGSGIRQVVIDSATASERREALYFLAGKLEALDRLNKDLSDTTKNITPEATR
jgi:hypothetical protein